MYLHRIRAVTYGFTDARAEAQAAPQRHSARSGGEHVNITPQRRKDVSHNITPQRRKEPRRCFTFHEISPCAELSLNSAVVFAQTESELPVNSCVNFVRFVLVENSELQRRCDGCERAVGGASLISLRRTQARFVLVF